MEQLKIAIATSVADHRAGRMKLSIDMRVSKLPGLLMTGSLQLISSPVLLPNCIKDTMRRIETAGLLITSVEIVRTYEDKPTGSRAQKQPLELSSEKASF